MKKVKLMLLSLSILAVVGGALAFTANGGIFYCTALTLSNGDCPIDCPAFTLLSDAVRPDDFLCTTNTIAFNDPKRSTSCQYTDQTFTKCDPISAHKTVEQ